MQIQVQIQRPKLGDSGPVKLTNETQIETQEDAYSALTDGDYKFKYSMQYGYR